MSQILQTHWEECLDNRTAKLALGRLLFFHTLGKNCPNHDLDEILDLVQVSVTDFDSDKFTEKVVSPLLDFIRLVWEKKHRLSFLLQILAGNLNFVQSHLSC